MYVYHFILFSAHCDGRQVGLGYQCKFVESVPEHFLCSECKGVARRLTFTSCCGESYCHGCITEIQQKGKPCPEKDKCLTWYAHQPEATPTLLTLMKDTRDLAVIKRSKI